MNANHMLLFHMSLWADNFLVVINLNLGQSVCAALLTTTIKCRFPTTVGHQHARRGSQSVITTVQHLVDEIDEGTT